MRKALRSPATREPLEQNFGGMLRALSLGRGRRTAASRRHDPPRLVMLLCGEENLAKWSLPMKPARRVLE